MSNMGNTCNSAPAAAATASGPVGSVLEEIFDPQTRAVQDQRLHPSFFQLDLFTVRAVSREEMEAAAGSGYSTPPPQVFFPSSDSAGDESPAPAPMARVSSAPVPPPSPGGEAEEQVPLPPLGESIAALLASKKEKDWAKRAVPVFCALLDKRARPQLEADAGLRAEVKKLIRVAYSDCSFTHCSLSLAEDLQWVLDGME